MCKLEDVVEVYPITTTQEITLYIYPKAYTTLHLLQQLALQHTKLDTLFNTHATMLL